MDKFTFLLENWYLFVAAIAVAMVIGVAVGKFLNMPTSNQIEKCKEWMLLAVVDAEEALGNGTGQIKLRRVYDLFIQRFPVVAKAISFDTFSLWVDEALVKMRKMLEENEAVRKFVKGDSDV